MSSATCSACGHENEADAKFCAECGAALGRPGEPAAAAGRDSGEADTVALPQIDDDVPVVALKGKKGKVAALGPVALPGSPPAAPPVGPPGAPVAAVAMPAEAPPSKRKWWLLAAAVAALVVIGVALFLILGGDDAKSDATSTLQESKTTVQPPISDAREAARLLQIRNAGRAAEDAQPRMDALLTRANSIEDTEIRTGTVAVVDAQRAYVLGLTRLTGLGQDELSRWPSIRRELRAATQRLEAAELALAPQNLGDPNVLFVPPADMRATTNQLDDTIGTAQQRLRTWRSQVARARRCRREGQTNVGGIAGYRASMQGIISDYFQDRERTRSFYNSADTYTPDAARAAIEGFRRDRQDTLSKMSGLTPPAGVASQQTQLIDVVTGSLDGLGVALTAVSQYESGSGSLTSQPAWAEFDQRSNSVTSSFNAAQGAWRSAVAAAEGQAAGPTSRCRIPNRPRV